jgi:hypothetical protein
MGRLTNIKKHPIDIRFLGIEAIVAMMSAPPSLIEQAGGLQGRGTGFHGKFILGYLFGIRASKPVCKRLAAISSKRCIDCARMYPPGFAVYITLGLATH